MPRVNKYESCARELDVPLMDMCGLRSGCGGQGVQES